LKVEVNEKLVLVGTAHVSQASVKEVEEAIRQYEPDVVAVELDEKRLEVLLNKKKWEETPITDMIRGGKAPFFLAQVFLASIQRRLGKEFGAEPGSEMLAAIKEAEKNAIRVELVDRDITITMRKAWRTMGFREKFRLFWEFSKAMVGYSDEEEIDLEEIMNEDVITMLIEELSEIAPSVTKILVFERDAYIAKKLSGLSEEGKVVAVVGAGHLKGIQENLAKIQETPSFEDLNAVPKKRIKLGKAIAYAIPILFFSLLIWLVYNGLAFYMVHNKRCLLGHWSRISKRPSLFYSHRFYRSSFHIVESCCCRRLVRRRRGSESENPYSEGLPGFECDRNHEAVSQQQGD
jgi:pheromone shutdown-related protein TraB